MQGHDLELNPLFLALQTEFVSIFRWVQQKCGIVCVPRTSLLSGLTITEQFVKMHTFRPSPFLKDHFLTQDEQYCVIVDDNVIITADGFPVPSERFRILAQELGYNEKCEKFSILVIDRPLVRHMEGQCAEMDSELDKWLYETTEWTLATSQKFLQHFIECSSALTLAEAELKRFRKSYVILPDYLPETASKLRDIWTSVTQLFVSLLRESLTARHVITDHINIAVECYVLGGLHDVVWSAVCKRCQRDDTLLVNKCQQLSRITAQQMSLPATFNSCNFSRAVMLLDALESCVCPREKLRQLKSVLDAVTATVGNDVKQQETDVDCLTSDDYISLLVLVIVRQTGLHLASNLFYLNTFLLYSQHADSLSYSLVTFNAAHQFMLSLPAGQIHAANKQTPDTQQAQGMSRAEWELERVGRLLTPTDSAQAAVESSSSRGDSQLDTPVTSWRSFQQPMSSTSQLGDFLSSLKSDTLLTNYGKQT